MVSTYNQYQEHITFIAFVECVARNLAKYIMNSNEPQPQRK
jgi:hypothetical protein